jgi:hypothetical protein
VTGHTILLEAENDTDAIIRAAKIFLSSFIIGSVLQGGIYQLYGIGFHNVGFYLFSAAFLFMTYVGHGFAIFFGFKAFKIPASLRDTLVFSIVSMSIFYPLVAVLSFFDLPELLRTLKAIKATNPDFGSGPWQLIFRIGQLIQIGNAHRDPVLGALVWITHVVGFVLGSWQITIVFCTLSRRWGVDRARIFDAGCFGLTVLSLLPAIALGLIYMITLYSFL